MAKHQQAQPKSPERIALVEAIQQAAATTARRHALAAARVTATSTLSAAREEAEKATAEVEAATKESANHLVAAAMGGAEDRSPPSIRQARERERDAEDAVAVARAAKEALDAMPEYSSETEEGVREALRRAALLVVRSEYAERTQAIVGEAEALCAEMSRLCGRLSWLFRNADLFERNVFGLATDGRVAAVLQYSGDQEAFQAGHADLERVIACLIENANAGVFPPALIRRG